MRIKIAVAEWAHFSKHSIDTNRLPTSFRRNIEIDMFKLNLTHKWLRLKALRSLPNVHDVMQQQSIGRSTRPHLVGVPASHKLSELCEHRIDFMCFTPIQTNDNPIGIGRRRTKLKWKTKPQNK